jgi:hypothetical protein
LRLLTLVAAAVTLTAVAATTACSAAAPTAAPAAATPAPLHRAQYQLGIDLDFYWHPDMPVSAAITADAQYARKLGANSVLISFPFYSIGGVATGGPATPSPAVIEQAVTAARAQGLQVGIRPLLDEANLGRARTHFQPSDPARWLQSYATFLVRYARAAQHTEVSSFYIGTELTMFAHEKQWTKVTRSVHSVFAGALYFSANWTSPHDATLLKGSGGQGVTVAADAYPVLPVPVAEFRAGWAAKAAILPLGTVLSEVGIPARQGAQSHPYMWKPSDAPLDPGLQAAWFTAACQAVPADHLGGIYFWSLSVGQSLTTPPSPRSAAQFSDSPGVGAVRACFTSLGAA